MEAGRTLLLGKLYDLLEPFSRCLGQVIEELTDWSSNQNRKMFSDISATLSVFTAYEF